MDHTGKKYGHLTLVEKLRPGGHGVGAVWKAKCDCGTEREVLAKDVVAGRVRSCGKCNYSRILRAESTTTSRVNYKKVTTSYERLVRTCLTRRVPFALSIEEYYRITRRECTFCGEPASEAGTRVGLVRRETGYTPRNTIPVCGECRKLQGDLDASDFLRRVMQIGNRVRELQSK